MQKNGQSIDGVMIEVLFTTVKQGLYLILHFKMLNAFFLGKALDKHLSQRNDQLYRYFSVLERI